MTQKVNLSSVFKFHLIWIVVFIVALSAQLKQYQVKTIEQDIIVQKAEHDAQMYKEEVEKLRIENYVMYDQLRQINANREFQILLEDSAN